MAEKMIEKLENVAADLIPLRKWMLITFLIAFIGVMPAAVGLMILFKNLIFFFLGLFVSVLGFTWSWGLFLISYWFNPDGGPLTLDKVKTKQPFLTSYAYVMRYVAPAFLIIWFLTPFVVLAMQVAFMTMMEK